MKKNYMFSSTKAFLFSFIQFAILCISFHFLSCSNKSPSFYEQKSTDEITVVSWNLQTFFDADKSGIEYSEFLKSDNWNKEKYLTRLNRLCESMKQLNADIFVFEELENENIMFDISNQFAAGSWKNKDFWTYTCFAKPEGTAIGCGIFSKYEITSLNTYSLDIRTIRSNQPSMRYIMKVNLNIKDNPLSIFVNHWKSKSGGAEESEIWRDWQESQLAGCLIQQQKEATPALVCGDFNRDIMDFIFDNNSSPNNSFSTVLLRNANITQQINVAVTNPWNNSDGDFRHSLGSYFFQNKWERIDHIFSLGKVEIIDFYSCAFTPFLNSYNQPNSYKIFTGEGYSDHLPVLALIRL